MSSHWTKANPETSRLPFQGQLDQVQHHWSEGGALWSAVVGTLLDIAYKAHPSGFTLDFDGTKGFSARGTNMRATVQLIMNPSGKYATVDVATSWPLTKEQEDALKKDKDRVLAKGLKGENLSVFVYMRYGTCEPPAQKKPGDKDLDAGDPLDDMEGTDPKPAQRIMWTGDDLSRSVRLCSPWRDVYNNPEGVNWVKVMEAWWDDMV
ncbi:hypothetical protein PG984_006589 [Apiospora sp. TS-2023a]